MLVCSSIDTMHSKKQVSLPTHQYPVMYSQPSQHCSKHHASECFSLCTRKTIASIGFHRSIGFYCFSLCTRKTIASIGSHRSIGFYCFSLCTRKTIASIGFHWSIGFYCFSLCTRKTVASIKAFCRSRKLDIYFRTHVACSELVLHHTLGVHTTVYAYTHTQGFVGVFVLCHTLNDVLLVTCCKRMKGLVGAAASPIGGALAAASKVCVCLYVCYPVYAPPVTWHMYYALNHCTFTFYSKHHIKL